MNTKIKAILLLVIGIVSCNKNEQVATTEIDTSQLISELKSINETLRLSRPETRISFKRFLDVALADAGGAWAGGKAGVKVGAAVGSLLGSPITGGAVGGFVGAVGFGAVSSWVAYPDEEISVEMPDYETVCDLCEAIAAEYMEEADTEDLYEEISVLDEASCKEDIASSIFIAQEILDDVELTRKELLVGEKHNIILAGLQGKIATRSNEMKKTRTTDTQDETMPSDEYLIIAEQIMRSEEMEEAYYSALEEFQYEEDHSLPAAVVNLFKEIFHEYPDNIQDVTSVINQYVFCIEQSDELTAEEKSWIRMGLAVSLYSYNYWSQAEN